MRKILLISTAALFSQLGYTQSIDSLMSEKINASVIIENNVTYKIDRQTYFFNKEQLSKASDAREVIATISGLFVDEQDNLLKTIGGKKVLVLINGIKAKDSDLQLISPEKIRKVDYYDVPPAKFMDEADAVINLHTSKLDTGWSGIFYGRGGQMYSNLNASIGYVSGNNKITLDIGAHFNQKRKVWDIENGAYSCLLGGNNYDYSYLQSSQTWGHQLGLGFKWLNSKDDNYVLQISLNMSDNLDKTQKLREIELLWGDIQQRRNGEISNNVKYLSPALDIYFSKVLSSTSVLTFDFLGTLYKNSQMANSSESSEDKVGGYSELMLLDTRKESFTGEINYEWNKDAHKLNFGYRGNIQWLQSNRLYDVEPNDITTVKTSTHKVFGEYSSQIRNFSYRVSIGATGNIKMGSKQNFKDIAFTPALLIGYKLRHNQFLRLKLTSGTEMPNIQQMSSNRIMIMEGFYRSGNENIRNSIKYGTQFMYIFQNNSFYITTDLHFSYISRPIYSTYIDKNEYWNFQAMNGHHFSEVGSNMVISYSPWEYIMFDIEASAEYQTFKKDMSSQAYHNWFIPIYANLTLQYKNFSMQYRHSLGGAFLNGIYLEGLEKVSYITLAYKYNNLKVSLQCLFPFVNDKFTSKTTSLSDLSHTTISDMRTKNHEFGITLSWNFVKGKSKDINKTIYNNDYDSGVFEL